MGCWWSSPYTRRIYRDPADLDEDVVPLRYFGTYRVGSNLIPDDIASLPNTHSPEYLASNADVVLYEAEIDHGKPMRCFGFRNICLVTPMGLAYYTLQPLLKFLPGFPCEGDEACCWLRKEYSTRTYFRVYSNRIELNEPSFRLPFGLLGCGSWNADQIVVHPFDRGAFGFDHIRAGSIHYFCCLWPVYGGVVVRHRCQCFGPLWNRMFTDCGGWWCDEWCCLMGCCSFPYRGFSDADEVAFVASIALQAYFEGRAILPEDMKRCVVFWKGNISERDDPTGRTRPVCCEPCSIPCHSCICCYKFTHPKRNIPYSDDDTTIGLKQVYEKYGRERQSQILAYESFHGPVRNSTMCRVLGCRRFFGRKGCCFCTEGCTGCYRKSGEPAPPFESHDFDDFWDASTVLMEVLGPPPRNVVIRRWKWDPDSNKNKLFTFPKDSALNNAQEQV